MQLTVSDLFSCEKKTFLFGGKGRERGKKEQGSRGREGREGKKGFFLSRSNLKLYFFVNN